VVIAFPWEEFKAMMATMDDQMLVRFWRKNPSLKRSIKKAYKSVDAWMKSIKKTEVNNHLQSVVVNLDQFRSEETKQIATTEIVVSFGEPLKPYYPSLDNTILFYSVGRKIISFHQNEDKSLNFCTFSNGGMLKICPENQLDYYGNVDCFSSFANQLRICNTEFNRNDYTLHRMTLNEAIHVCSVFFCSLVSLLPKSRTIVLNTSNVVIWYAYCVGGKYVIIFLCESASVFYLHRGTTILFQDDSSDIFKNHLMLYHSQYLHGWCNLRMSGSEARIVGEVYRDFLSS
jgi:hypothetical protein